MLVVLVSRYTQFSKRDKPSASNCLWEGKLRQLQDCVKKTPLPPPYPGPSYWVQRFTFVKKEKRCYNKQASRVPVKNMIFSTLRGNST